MSRWAALLWAGGILWTAVDTVGFRPPAAAPNATAANATAANASADPDTDATGVDVNSADLAILANVMKGN